MRDRGEFTELLNALRHKDPQVRRNAAVVMLWKLGGRQAVGPLIPTVDDEEVDARDPISEALEQLRDAGVVGPDRQSERGEVESMKELDWLREIEEEDEDWLEDWLEEEGVLGELMEAILWPGPDVLSHPDPQVRLEKAIAALKDKDYRVRGAAVLALGKTGDPRAVEPLIAVTYDGEMDVRDLVYDALKKLKEAGVVEIEPAIAVLNQDGGTGAYDKDDVAGNNLRYWAAGVLATSGDPRAVEPLIAALGHDHDQVRMEAVKGLGELGDPRALVALVATFDNENEWGSTRADAVEALRKLGSVAVEPLVGFLNDKRKAPYFRARAADQLGMLADPQVIKPLIAALEDPSQHKEVRESVESALERIGGEEAERALTEYRRQR